MKRGRRRLLEIGRGDKVVLMFAVVIGFGWLLRRWHAPSWLYVAAMVALYFVFARYRWITGGRERAKAAIRDIDRALRERRDRG